MYTTCICHLYIWITIEFFIFTCMYNLLVQIEEIDSSSIKKNIIYGNFNMKVGYEKIISLISTVLQLLNLYYRDHRGLQVDPGQRLASIWPNWSVNWM